MQPGEASKLASFKCLAPILAARCASPNTERLGWHSGHHADRHILLAVREEEFSLRWWPGAAPTLTAL